MARSTRPKRRLAAVLLVISMMVGAMAAPAMAEEGIWWTKGSSASTPAGSGLGYTIAGPVRMTRFEMTPKSVVEMLMTGFVSRKKYPAVVHSGLCTDSPVGGAVWGGGFSFTATADRDGNISGTAHYPGVVDTSGRSIVFYDYDGSGTAIACVHLK